VQGCSSRTESGGGSRKRLVPECRAEHNTRQSRSPDSIRFVGSSDLSLVERSRGPVISSFSPLTRLNKPPQAYLAAIVASCRNFLVAFKCWNTGEPLLAVVEVDMMVGFQAGDLPPGKFKVSRHLNEMRGPVAAYLVQTSQGWYRRKPGRMKEEGLRSVFSGRRQRPTTLAPTTMSSFPPEILDLITDHLHDEPTTLKACCVVSKSWIHRTRTHLFAHVEFHASKSHTELWKKTFPDLSKSPAHHTRSILIYGLSVITTADGGVGGWIRSFHNLVHLHLGRRGSEDHRVSLVPFQGLSPTLRSLRLTSTSLEILDLICSFPLLEDLALVTLRGGGAADVWNIPSTSPKLTGSLSIFGGIIPAACRLVGLPNGLNFTKISVAYLDEDVKSTTDLVSSCSNTLESFSIYYYTPGVSPSSFYEWSIPYQYSWT
jgi:hypothetical protein